MQTSVYVHVPFCRAKCAYCDFASYPRLDHLFSRYVECVCEEARKHWAQETEGDTEGVRIESVYVGGGTPTVLDARLLRSLLDACAPTHLRAPDLECTVEANPGTVNRDMLADLLSAGFNRISIGVQSLDDDELRLLGRIHSSAEALETIAAARQAGFGNISVDLMYGLPGQTNSTWTRTLETVLASSPNHLSAYPLTIEEGTALATAIEEARLPAPEEEAVLSQYETLLATTSRAGLDRYEIANWSTPGMQCRHNLRYWRNQPYVGFGAAAHSSSARARGWNVRVPEEYIRRVSAGHSPVDQCEQLDVATQMWETMILGLRLTTGIDRETFRSRFTVDPEELWSTDLQQLVAQGLIECSATHIRLTRRGVLLGNEVFCRLLSICQKENSTQCPSSSVSPATSHAEKAP